MECRAITVRDLSVNKRGEFGELKAGAVGVNGVQTVIECVGLQDGGSSDVREGQKRNLYLLGRAAE